MRGALRFLALAATGVLMASAATAPAAAQNLHFGFGIGPGMYFGGIDEGEDIGGACLSDYLLRQYLGRQGWDDIKLGLANDHHMPVVASRGGVSYKLLVNSCSGKVLSRERRR
jgi:hypothetical protein